MVVSIFNTINSDLALNQEDGVMLYEAIAKANPTDLTISFEGISRVSTAFLNESIGAYTQQHPEAIKLVKFLYPSDNEIFKFRVEDIIENALLGDTYDSYVDNTLMSL